MVLWYLRKEKKERRSKSYAEVMFPCVRLPSVGIWRAASLAIPRCMLILEHFREQVLGLWVWGLISIYAAL